MVKKILISLMAVFIIGLSANAENVVFNTKTLKYHKPGCEWAKKCTKNCILMDKKKAKARGGVPCKVCGG